jgi:hypothetical protein
VGHVRKPAKSMMSGSSFDKMMACLNWPCTASDFKLAPDYFDACARWWNRLSPGHRETALTVIDVYGGPHRSAAEGIAASLPKCPELA